MKYCAECGAPLENEQAFCQACGTKGAEKIQPRRPMSKKKKVSLAIFGVLVIGLVTSHLIVSSILNPLKTVQAMDRAVADNNSALFMENVELDENALIDHDQYLSYIKNANWENVRPQLVAIMQSDTELDSIVVDSYNNDLFKVKKNSILGLYNTYEIHAIPNKIRLSTNLESTFRINDVSVDVKSVENPVELTEAYPGTYSVSGETTSLFGTLHISEEIQVNNNSNHISDIELNFPTEEYHIATKYPGATLFVNGESTDKTLEELVVLGPFPKDKEVTLHAEWTGDDGETLISDQITQNDQKWGSLSFSFEEKDSQAVVDQNDSGNTEERYSEENQHVLDFRSAYEKALNAKNFELVADYLLPGSEAEEELIDYIGDLQDKEYSYEFTENSITESKNVKEDTFEISTLEIFVFTNHLGEKTVYQKEKIYTLMDSDYGYKIEKIDIKDTERNQL
ncbi:TcaA NTF2-like domain-containing protein [Bacillus sp. 2205SS5-2]|uniref:TcaA NTF2-like domain-containing protein n=1 Tax=Bacillus sp. 2205SS5-2 TaxID=3109031 RepID=UPI003007EC3A